MAGKFADEILNEIDQNGYHFLRKSCVQKDFYPNVFPDFGKIEKISAGQFYAVRLFIPVGTKENRLIDSRLIDVEIQEKIQDKFSCKILTKLPDVFPLKTAEIIFLTEDEILFERT